MAQPEDPKLATFVRDHLPTLRERLAPLQVIAFGSRVRGDALSTSDLDLVLVSPWFASVPFLKPEEFEEKRQEFGIVRVAVEQGIALS